MKVSIQISSEKINQSLNFHLIEIANQWDRSSGETLSEYIIRRITTEFSATVRSNLSADSVVIQSDSTIETIVAQLREGNYAAAGSLINKLLNE